MPPARHSICATVVFNYSINMQFINDIQYALIKNKIKGNKEIRRDRMQSHIWLTSSSYMGKICAFPHQLGSPSSYMTLHPIPSEFPYIWGKILFSFFISVGHRIQEEKNNTMEQKMKSKTTGVRKWWEENQAFCCRMICVHYRPPSSYRKGQRYTVQIDNEKGLS